MAYYLLKVGSFAAGTVGDEKNPYRQYQASDPANNVIESDQDLAARFPSKFSYYDGPAPKNTGGILNPGPNYVRGQEGDPPPGPPSEQDVAEAAMAKPLTVSDARKRADWHRQQAEMLDQQASDSERAYAQSQEQQKAQKGEPSEAAPKAQSAPTQEKIPPDHELESKTKDELLDLAEYHEVNVHKSANKPEIIKALKQARK
jgi:hypothetical protein